MELLKTALEDLLNHPAMAVAEAVDKHFSHDFRQCVNGEWLDLPSFTERIVALRSQISHATIHVLDEFIEDSAYAQRHVIRLFLLDGSVTAKTVFVFAKRDSQGRFTQIEESSHAVNENAIPWRDGR